MEKITGNIEGGDQLTHVIAKLRPYQIEGVNFLLNRKGSLESDDMG